MRQIQAVGFDLGETLIYFEGVPLNWQPLYREALAAVVSRCGAEKNDEALTKAEAVLARYNGRLNPRRVEITTEQVWGDILAALNLSHFPADTASEAFFQVILTRRALYPDTLPALESLCQRGLPLGVLTDVPYGMPKAVASRMMADIESYFNVWLTSVEAGYCKPDPQGLFHLAERLGVAPDQMAYIGNEPKDIQAAKSAGMYAVLVNRTGDALNYGEDRQTASLTDAVESLDL